MSQLQEYDPNYLCNNLEDEKYIDMEHIIYNLKILGLNMLNESNHEFDKKLELEKLLDLKHTNK